MNAESEVPAEPQSGGSASLTTAIMVVAIAAIGFAILMRQGDSKPRKARPAPEIKAAGWLNGPGPTAEDLKGKVIVVDAWAYWCGPCRATAPDMVALHEKYHEQGVVFVGLTSEGSDVDEQNRQFLKATRFTWPNGYGAVQTLTNLHADFIPQRWVIDRNYNLVWDEGSREPIDSAIDRALAETPKSDSP